MKKFPYITWFVLLAMFIAHKGQAQGTLEPLYYSIVGNGSVTSLTNGQPLEVGRSYEMQAIAGAGYIFSGWQQVNVFELTQFTLGAGGEPNPPEISYTPSVIPGIYSSDSMLDFTMLSGNLIFNIPDVEEITQGMGWQADFTPVPEPSSGALVMSGAIAIGLLRKRVPESQA